MFTTLVRSNAGAVVGVVHQALVVQHTAHQVEELDKIGYGTHFFSFDVSTTQVQIR